MGAAHPVDSIASFADAAHCVTDAVFDALPLGLIVFDRRLRIGAANVVARALIADAPDAPTFLKRLCADGPGVDWQSELRDVWQRRMTRRHEAVTNEGGTDARYYDLVIRPVSGATTRGIVGVILIDDVTARITMQRRLAISERMAAIGKVAARVAHELNNPLDGILRYANLAGRRLDDGGGREKVREYLDRICEGSLRMSGIVRDLLAFSRSGANVERESTLDAIVSSAIDAMSASAREQSVAIHHVSSEMDAPVNRGSGLFQVFCNLIKNAIDAMADGGVLTVLTESGAGGMRAMFDDTGPGVADPERIFEAFYTTKEAGKGTGLGLAVSREIVESLGGTITAENRGDGGARFTVWLPR